MTASTSTTPTSGDRASVEALMRATHERLGRLDVLVCNAGVSNDGMVRDLDPKAWAEVIDTNLTGTFTCVQEAVPYLERQGGGRIIVISSALSTRVSPGAGAYSVSKAAIDMFTKVCAAEFAGTGIMVNAVAPRIIDQGLGARLAENDLVLDAVAGRLLAGRPGRGEEVGNAVVFLAPGEGSYVNSHVTEVPWTASTDRCRPTSPRRRRWGSGTSPGTSVRETSGPTWRRSRRLTGVSWRWC